MSEFEWTVQLRLLLALALGFLVGLEREQSALREQKKIYAGVRTFTIISLFGFACAWLYRLDLEVAIPAGLVALAILIVAGYYTKTGVGHVGWTSEIAALLTFLVGVMALLADVWLALALGIINTVLLSEKTHLEKLVERLDKTDFLAVLRFLIVTLIILPVLPDQDYTAYELNPRQIWEIVILVSSIGFVGYILSKRFGSKTGLRVSGVLGGLISSTAVAVASGRIAQRNPDHTALALQSSILASSVMYLRILGLVAVLNTSLVPHLAWQTIVLALIGGGLSLGIKGKSSDPPRAIEGHQNPFEIKPAILFAILFTAVSILTTVVTNAFGIGGLYALAAIVGVTDIDPFVLSLAEGGNQAISTLVAAILIAMMSNTWVKGVYFSVLTQRHNSSTLWRYSLWAVLHIPVLLLS